MYVFDSFIVHVAFNSDIANQVTFVMVSTGGGNYCATSSCALMGAQLLPRQWKGEAVQRSGSESVCDVCV